MIVAVAFAGMVQVAVHQIVGVVAVRHGFMPAAGAVHMRFFMTAAVMPRRAQRRVIAAHRDAMLLNPSLPGVVQMAILQIIGVTLVLHRWVATVGTMGVGVAIVYFLSCHDYVLAKRN